MALPVLSEGATCAERRLEFIHVNRAAGSAVDSWLRACRNVSTRLSLHAGEHEHVTARQSLATWDEGTGTCAAQRLDAARCAAAWRASVFSFAIVRDPFDRQVRPMHVHVSCPCARALNTRAISMTSVRLHTFERPLPRQVSIFHSLLERECTPAHHSARSPSRQCQVRRFPYVDEARVRGHAAHVAAFRQWLRALDSSYPVGSSRNALFSATAAADARLDASQLAWIEDGGGHVAVSAVLRFEDELPAAFARLAAECLLGCAAALPHTLRSTERAAHHLYYDAESEAIVRRQSARDFAAFNYSDRVLPMPPSHS